MVRVVFKYKNENTFGKWETQECVVNSMQECKKIYGLGVDCEYRILSVSNMKKYKNLTEEDIEILKEWEVPEEDIEQMDEFYGKTYYYYVEPVKSIFDDIKYDYDKKKKITVEKAREILGNVNFLSGLNRSAFHRTSERTNNNGERVCFDSSHYWRKIIKETEN